MKNLVLLLFLLFIGNILRASFYPEDSILFSEDGKHVLERGDGFLNSCEIEWWKFYDIENTAHDVCLAIQNDSVYFCSYNEKFDSYPELPCKGTWIKITRRMSKEAFQSTYNFKPALLLTSPNLIFSVDTIRKYNRLLIFAKSPKDTSEYFNLRIKLYLDSELLFTDTFSTNNPYSEIGRYISEYSIYLAKNKQYYFVSGGYSYGEFSASPGSYGKTNVETKYIVKRK